MRTLALCSTLLGLARTAAAADPLPEGDAGIAAQYPGDAGIGDDPAVIFADDFEGYADASELGGNWTAAVYQPEGVRIATEPGNVFGGAQALEFTVPQQDAELSNAVDRTVSPELDVMHLRFYSKFMSPYDIVGSSHNGGMIASHYFIDGQATPGVPADGTNKWLVNVENWRGEAETASPGLLNIYIYHPEQRSEYGDHFWSDGTITPYDPDPPPDYFGPDFIPRDNIIPPLDEWHCYELMVQANTPGQRDGRIAFWYDGMLAGDFGNLRLRDVPELTIDRFGLAFHIGTNPDAEQKKWYDNVVAATAYIGPVYGGGGNDSGGGSSGGGGSDGGGSGGGADGSGGGGDSGGASFGGDAGETGTAGGSDSGAGADGGGAASGDDASSGCGCRSDGVRASWLTLLLLGARRRRRR